jgi:tripartite-type tricarboxylate transporter receptor subunit TctC
MGVKNPGNRRRVRHLNKFAALATAAFAIGISVPEHAQSQNYPVKPIRIVTGAPAGGADVMARLLGQTLAGSLGQPVIIDNRAGTTSGEIVARSIADGYTLLVAGSSFWVEPLFKKTPVDPMRGLVPLSLLVDSPNILVTTLSLPVKSVKDLIDMARAKPGALNYASSTLGGSPQVAGELFKHMAAVNIVGVPYKGAGPAISDVMGSHVQMMFPAASAVASHIKGGKLRALGIGSAQPSPQFPGLPTIAATVPGYEAGGGTALLAPAGVPAAIIKTLSHEVVRAFQQPEIREKVANLGVEAVGSTPAQLAAKIKSETARISRLVEAAGLREP